MGNIIIYTNTNCILYYLNTNININLFTTMVAHNVHNNLSGNVDRMNMSCVAYFYFCQSLNKILKVMNFSFIKNPEHYKNQEKNNNQIKF